MQKQGSLHSQGQAALGIKAASELLGVPAPTIRSWERRYGLRPGSRSSGGHRRYGEDDLAVLARMRDEVARGRAAAQAAMIAAAGAAGTSEALRGEVLSAAGGLDGRAIAGVLDRARDLLGLEATVDDVLLPAMREIGRLWSVGGCDVAHEHAATSSVSGWLARVRLEAPMPPPSADTVVLACGPRDLHTLGLDCLAALLENRGVDCRLLAARTPVASLVLAVQEAAAAAAVVASSLASARPAAVAAIQAVAATGTPTYYGGAAFRQPRSRATLPDGYLGDRLSRAADLLLATLARPEAAARREGSPLGLSSGA